MRPRVLIAIVGAALTTSFAGAPDDDPARAPEPAAFALVRDPEPSAPRSLGWTRAQPAISFFNTHTRAMRGLRLYRDDGSIDESAAGAIDAVLADRDAPVRRLDRRLLQLVVKAAGHFHAEHVQVISSFRDNARKGSRHRHGRALDFVLAGVPASKLASYLRKGARVGVGVYVHKRTQYVHLDVRDESYHWADGSPPGRWWRESRMTDRGAAARDAAYRPEQDLPERNLPSGG